MVNVTARCPYCEETFRSALAPERPVECTRCHKTLQSTAPAWLFDEARDAPQRAPGTATQCVACPSTELFVRKDFPQRLGVALVALAFIASSIAWYHHRIIISYAVLFFTALIDVVLYLFMGNVLECYRCHAQYRGLQSLAGHESFNLETHERYRQEAARLRQATPTAGQSAPPPPTT